MDTNGQSPTFEQLHSHKIPIAKVSPTAGSLLEGSIHAAVTLLWPYSSSTKSLCLLLAEPDFLLRRLNGQVKVIFHGHIAENVAKTKVGIGDDVYLSLVGARFVKSETATQTPGKCIPWDLHFDDRVLLEIYRSSELLTAVKLGPLSSPLPDIRVTSPTPVTPMPKESFRIDGTEPVTTLKSWKSPAFLGQAHKSFDTIINTSFDPFLDEDGYIPGKGRKRPRFSMRGSEWRVIDEPDSPGDGDNDMPLDWAHIFDEEEGAETDNEEKSAHRQSPKQDDPAPLSSRGALNNAQSTDADISNVPSSSNQGQQVDQIGATTEFIKPMGQPRFGHMAIDTPRLHPIPSPGLPIPSPIVTTSNSQQGYFGSTVFVNQTRLGSDVAHLSQDGVESTEGDHYLSSDSTRIENDQTHMMVLDEADAGSRVAHPPAANPMACTSDKIDDGCERSEDIIHDYGTVISVTDKNVTEAAVHSHSNIAQDRRRTASVEEGRESAAGKSYDKHNDNTAESEDMQEEDIVKDYRQESEHIGAGDVIKHRLLEDIQDLAESEDDESVSDRSTSPTSQVHDGPEKVSDYTSEDEEIEGHRDDEDEDEEHDEEDEDEIEAEDGYYHVESDVGSFGEDEIDEASLQQDSDQVSVEDDVARAPPKHVQPEVIVLDSDSEDEPPFSRPAQTYDTTIHASQSSATSEEEESMPEENFPRAKSDGWSDTDGSMGNEGIEARSEDSDQRDNDSVRATLVEDQSMDDRHSVPGSLEDEWRNDEQSEANSADDGYVEQGETYSEDRFDADRKMNAAVSFRYDSEEGTWNQGQPEVHDSTRSPHATSYALSPSNDDSSNSGPSEQPIQRPHFDQDQPVPDVELVIDPELYNFAPSHDTDGKGLGLSVEQIKANAEPTKPKTLADTAHDLHDKYALILDGGGASVPEQNPINVTVGLSAPSPQLITPEPSQVTNVAQYVAPDVPMEVDTAQPLPTPIHTQTPTRDLGISTFVQLGDTTSEIVPEETTPLVGEFHDEVRNLQTPNHRLHPSIEKNMILEPTESSTLHENAPLQPRSVIGDDESIGTVDSVHLVTVDRHYPGLRSKLSYFAPLATLIDHYNSSTDTMSVVSQVLPVSRATSGKKDYYISLQLTDPSMAGTTVSAEIFRPYKSALPSPQEGDAILLRDFMVRSFEHSMMLVSADSSSWAVFSSAKHDVQVNGPPVEYGKEEQSHATDLRQWYQENGMAMVADNQLQASIERASRDATPASSAGLSDTGSIDSAMRDARADSSISSTRSSRRSRRSHRRITIHELRDGTRYTEVGSPSGKDSIHELRDGTVYAHL